MSNERRWVAVYMYALVEVQNFFGMGSSQLSELGIL